MDALDGNAIAGQLLAAYGTEMTLTCGACTNCATRSLIAELEVYTRAPGSVARCPGCGAVLIVVVQTGETTEVHVTGFELEPQAGTPDRQG
jgi:uncharacterized Zn finger protein